MPPKKEDLGIPLGDIPEFERPIALKQKVARGNLKGADAHVASIAPSDEDPNTIYVDNPAAMNPGIWTHELTHQIQRQAGGVTKQPNTPALLSEKDPAKFSALWDSIYGYGGADGLRNLKSIGSLNTEQQGRIPQDYVDTVGSIRSKPGGPTMDDMRQMDTMNQAYARPIHQLANMANPSTDTIDTTPQAPGPPPAALTGMAKPLPDVGGQTLYGIPSIRGKAGIPPIRGRQ